MIWWSSKFGNIFTILTFWRLIEIKNVHEKVIIIIGYSDKKINFRKNELILGLQNCLWRLKIPNCWQASIKRSYKISKNPFRVAIKVWVKKWDTFKMWPLIESQYFCPILIKQSPFEVMIFTKFHEDRTKIEDFLLMSNFWTCFSFFDSDFIMQKFIELHCLSTKFHNCHQTSLACFSSITHAFQLSTVNAVTYLVFTHLVWASILHLIYIF